MTHPDAVTCTWEVPTDHPAFAGHFPGRPIVPGVVLLQQALQLAQKAQATQLAGQQVQLQAKGAWQVTQAKFLSPVGPGENLVLTLQASPRGAWQFTVHAPDRAVASGTLLFCPTRAPTGGAA